MTRSNTVATQGDAHGDRASHGLAEFAAWISAMQTEASIVTADDAGFDPATVLQAILTAGTFEDAVEAQSSSLLSGKQLTGQPHTIYDFEIRKSDDKYNANERSLGVYAIVSAADENGAEFKYGVGAANVLAILWQARQFGRLPGKFILKSRETRNGELLSLMPLKTAVQA